MVSSLLAHILIYSLNTEGSDVEVSSFIFGGNYGLYIDSAYLRSFGGLVTSRIFQHTGDVFIVAENSGDSVFYSGNDVTVWARWP